MSSEMVEEINQFMLDMFKEHSFEDTVENRIAFLEGLQDAWSEMPVEPGENGFGKTMYRLALTGELMRLKVQVSLQGINV